MSEKTSPPVSPFAARTRGPSAIPQAAPTVAAPAAVGPVPVVGKSGRWVGGAVVATMGVLAVAAWMVWGGGGPAAVPVSEPAPAVETAMVAAAQPETKPVTVARDAKADYEALSKIAAAGVVLPQERAALATAALRAADGAYAEAVDSVGPVAVRMMIAAYAEQAAVLEGVKLADHDEPAVRRVRAALAEATEREAERRWAEAVAARMAATAALPEARREIAGRFAAAAVDAAGRGDKSLAIYFYQQGLRLNPENAAARAYLFANRYGAGQGMRTPGGVEMVYAPPGVFMRGSRISEPGRDADEVQAEVRLPSGVFVSVTEVTQREWDQVFGPGEAARVIAAAPAGSKAVGPELPMHSIRWDEAVEFCRRLSAKDGAKYRLPTEAEWEYACRAGASSAFNTGADYLALSDAVIDDGSNLAPVAPAPAGTVGRANAWGLRDMHGNVWEWCADWSAPYATGAVVAPRGPDDVQMGRADLAMRVVRGGGWNTSARDARSANRWEYPPDAATGYIGLRFVMEPDLTAP